MTHLDKIIHALVEAEVGRIRQATPDSCDYEFHFVLGQMHALPWFFRFSLIFLSLIFNVLMGGFSLKSEARRRAILTKLHQKKWPILKEFVTFFESLAAFAHYAAMEDADA